MSDTAIDGGSAPVEQEAKAPALKSTDTRVSADAPTSQGVPPAEKEKKAEPKEKADEESAPPEGDNAPAAESPERKEQRLPRWMKERLERERKVTEARTREAVLRELQQQGQRPEPLQRQPEPQGERELTLEDFDFDPTAHAKYLARRAIEEYKREEQARAEQTKQAAAAEQFKAKIDSFEAKVGAGAWEDIEASAINQDPAYKPLVELFLGDENDLEMAYHLAQNPAEADRLLALPPLQRVREVAKLADKFSSAADAKAAVPQKRVTNAPPPPKTVSGAGKPNVDLRNPEITTADRIKAWKAGRG